MSAPKYVEIPVTQGLVTLVDVADVQLAGGRWYARKEKWTFYATRNVCRADGTRAIERLHRVLFGLTDPRELVDHVNGNGLDNRRSNLRLATEYQNQGNQRLRRDNTSGFKGVHWNKDARRWRAQVRPNGRQTYLGYYATAREAALAYDMAAREHWGAYACLNFPGPGERSVRERGENTLAGAVS